MFTLQSFHYIAMAMVPGILKFIYKICIASLVNKALYKHWEAFINLKVKKSSKYVATFEYCFPKIIFSFENRC